MGITLTILNIKRNAAETNSNNVAQTTNSSTINSNKTINSNLSSNVSKSIKGLQNTSANQISADKNINSSRKISDTSSENAQPSTPVPTPITVRYATGKELVAPQNTGGRGTLDISNGTDSDAVAKLVDVGTNKTIRLTYIQSNSALTVKNIKVGSYVLKFSLGSGYIPETGKFQYSQSFSKFDEIMNFGEYREGNRIVWDNFRVTLNKVLNGNASTSSIDESDFADK